MASQTPQVEKRDWNFQEAIVIYFLRYAATVMLPLWWTWSTAKFLKK